jgi:hypothetical protein
MIFGYKYYKKKNNKFKVDKKIIIRTEKCQGIQYKKRDNIIHPY